MRVHYLHQIRLNRDFPIYCAVLNKLIRRVHFWNISNSYWNAIYSINLIKIHKILRIFLGKHWRSPLTIQATSINYTNMISTDRCRITSGEKEKLKRKDKDDRKIMTHNSEKIDHEILAVFFLSFRLPSNQIRCTSHEQMRHCQCCVWCLSWLLLFVLFL